MTDLAELAVALHKQADERRERAMNARREREAGVIAPDECDAWAVAFSTSYQTLRGIALACEEVAALRARETSHE